MDTNHTTAMNSIKDLEDDMNDNLSHEIMGMGNGSMGIEEAFLSGNSPSETQSRSQSTGFQRSEGTSVNDAKDKSSIPSGARASGQTKAFRFVNNSPNSMYKQKSRMKPTFKVETQAIQSQNNTQGNQESVIIEQNFNNSGADLQTTNDKKYVFQLNVKRPPGRPRKYPLEKPKAKRPQGRPRKYPAEITGSTIGSSKITKKPIKDASHDLPIDTELISSKRGRGRPKREDKDLENQDIGSSDAYGDERNFAIATAAGATQSAANETNNHKSS